MVQRKEPETRRRQHVRLERQSSCQQQQDNLKMKMKLERSIRAADLESLQNSPPMKPNKRSPAARGSPNYMRPTSSSDAKKEQLQVTPHSKTPADMKRSPKNSNSPKTSSPLSVSLSRQSSLKAIRPLIKKSLIKGVVVNRATCSSTLKDLRFPEALDLNPGGTEAEGTSVMRVCPYTYCSLNGHRHEPLPPLKCFVSARRKLLRTQKSMKMRGLNPLRAKVLSKDKGSIDTAQKATSKVPSVLEVAPPMEEEPDDFFVEIYTTSNPVDEVGVNESAVDEVAAELKQELYQKVAEIAEAIAPEYGHLEGNDTKSRGEELCRDDVLDQEPESSEEENENEGGGTNLLSMVQLFNSSDGNEESDQVETEDERIRIQQQLVIEYDDATEDASSSSNISDDNDAGESWESENEQEEINPLEGTMTKPKARRRVTRKKIAEEPDNLREFNPRAPNFLDVEPDPEAEKVDLRHQMMDERKNAEEYLIDYALRRAVTKLAPDRKKKVALLVEAFETVMPLPAYEKPLRQAVSDFILTRMQACS